MVGGLVKNEEVRLLQKESCQKDASLLAPTEMGKWEGPFILGKTETCQDFA